MTVLVTGYDILILLGHQDDDVRGYAMNGELPFHTIALHGMVRDKFWQEDVQTQRQRC